MKVKESQCHVTLIAAIGKNRELGKDNGLLWRLSADMAFFKETTTHHWVIMGRKSYESLPPKFRPLPNRVNAVITRDPHYNAAGCRMFNTLESAIEEGCKESLSRIFVIGGAQIYSTALEHRLIDEMYLTHVDGAFPDADVFFPEIDSTRWNVEVVTAFAADDKNQFGGEIAHYVLKSD